jgi:hypothetical protein
MNKIFIPQQYLEKPFFPLLVELDEEVHQENEWVRIKFDKVRLLIHNAEGRSKWFEADGEFQVIANISKETDILDENGEPFEIDSLYIPELKGDDFLPHIGGKLVLYLDHPECFLDIHMLVMEGANGSQELTKIIKEAKKNSQLALFLYKNAH